MPQYIGKQDDEFFSGNIPSPEIPEHIQPIAGSVRLGEVALDVDGKKLPPCYRPVFIKNVAADVYDRIMMSRFNAIRA